MINSWLNSWWILVLAIFCFGLYEQGAKRLEKEMRQLQEQIDQVLLQTAEAKVVQEKLRCQVNSQSDPAWIELTLIKCLGLVPEGYKKVYFEEKKE